MLELGYIYETILLCDWSTLGSYEMHTGMACTSSSESSDSKYVGTAYVCCPFLGAINPFIVYG